MGCSSSTHLVAVDDTQQTLQTDLQQCVLTTNANKDRNSDTTAAVSTQSLIEEDVLNILPFPEECSDASKKLNTDTKDILIPSNLPTTDELEITAGKNGYKHSKVSDRLIKIQEEAKPELNEQMLRDQRVITEFKYKQQLKKANSENSHKEKTKRDSMAARDFRNSQKQTSEPKSITPADSNVTTEVVDGIQIKEEQVGQTSLDSLDDSYNSSEERIVIENDRCFNQDTDNFWEDSLHPDPLDPEAPGSVITM